MSTDIKRDEFQGKRLLLLGGTPLMCHVVRKAKEMGIYTIVTDYYDETRAPAKLEADEAHMVSTLDVPALVELAKDRQVDGVFTGYSDITLEPCRQVCAALGLPFYATEKQIARTMNKKAFKALCKKNDVPVVPDIDPVALQQDPAQVDYPIIIKPADSYSSRGISVCHKPEEAPAACEKALEASKTGELVVEPFITGDDVWMYFTVRQGDLTLSAMADRLMSDEQKGMAPQPSRYLFPSRYTETYARHLHPKLQAFVADLGLRDGTFVMQGFATSEEILLFEMGLRLSAGAGHLVIHHENGVDRLRMHLSYALGRAFDDGTAPSQDSAAFRNRHCVSVVLLRNGTIGSVTGWEALLAHPSVYGTTRLRNPGDVLAEAGTLNQVFSRIYICAPDDQSLRQAVFETTGLLDILDTEGQSMLLEPVAIPVLSCQE